MAVRTIEVRERVMAKNDELAAAVRERLRARGCHVVQPGVVSGLGKDTPAGADARRRWAKSCALRSSPATCRPRTTRTGWPAIRTGLVQAVVTGGACHLDARQVATALDALDLDHTRLLFIENVGNLVCPASWDLGEDAKIVVFSVTEGEDKPLKYPKMFRESRYAVLNKIDLLPYVPFDVDRALAYAREVNPELQFFLTSALTGEGLDQWFAFLRSRTPHGQPGMSSAAPAPPVKRVRLHVTGVVQGVGFRPFVHRLALLHGLGGWVRNASGDVEIEVEGPSTALEQFLESLETDAPPLARIERVNDGAAAARRGDGVPGSSRAGPRPTAASRSLPTWPSVRRAKPNCSIRPTGGIAIPSSRAPTAGRATR